MEDTQLHQFIITRLKERSGISFAELFAEMVNNGMIMNTREDRKRLVALIRGIEINGTRGSFLVCPLRKKEKYYKNREQN